MTIIRDWILVSFVLGFGMLADQLRRPAAAWEAAGRDRAYWIWATLVLGLHALGPFIATGYVFAVLPRFGNGPQTRFARIAAGPTRVYERCTSFAKDTYTFKAQDQVVYLAAVLVWVSGLIHALVIADHYDEYWLAGVFFAVVTVLQVLWAGQASYRASTRLLLAGAIGNGALAVIWAISRTVGVPLGPHPMTPEAVGVIDVLSTLDELAAVFLLALVLVARRERRPAMSVGQLRLAVTLAGPLFLFSVMAAFGGHHHPAA